MKEVTLKAEKAETVFLLYFFIQSGERRLEINVKNAYDIDTNSYKYSGIAIFDCTPAIGEAFVKLAKAAE